jgi:hypothetical protein
MWQRLFVTGRDRLVLGFGAQWVIPLIQHTFTLEVIARFHVKLFRVAIPFCPSGRHPPDVPILETCKCTDQHCTAGSVQLGHSTS